MITKNKTEKASVDMLANAKLSESFVNVREAIANAIASFEDDFVVSFDLSPTDIATGEFFRKESFKAPVFVCTQKGEFYTHETILQGATHVILIVVNERKSSFDMYFFRKADFDTFFAQVENPFSEADVIEKAEKAGLCKFYRHKKRYIAERVWQEDGQAKLNYDYSAERNLWSSYNKRKFCVGNGGVAITSYVLERVLEKIFFDRVHLVAHAYNYEKVAGTDFIAHRLRTDEEMRLKIKYSNTGVFTFLVEKYFRRAKKFNYYIGNTDTTHYLLIHLKSKNEADVFLVEAGALEKMVLNKAPDRRYFENDEDYWALYKSFSIPARLDKYGIKYEKVSLVFDNKRLCHVSHETFKLPTLD